MEKPVFIDVRNGEYLIRIDQIVRIEREFDYPENYAETKKKFLAGLVLHTSTGFKLNLNIQSHAHEINKIIDLIQIV